MLIEAEGMERTFHEPGGEPAMVIFPPPVFFKPLRSDKKR